MFQQEEGCGAENLPTQQTQDNKRRRASDSPPQQATKKASLTAQQQYNMANIGKGPQFRMPPPLSPEMEAVVARLTRVMDEKLNEKLNPIIGNLDSIKQMVTTVQTDLIIVNDEMEMMRKRLLSRTLMIFGLEEAPKENYHTTEGKVDELAQKLGITDLDFENLRRVGRPVPGKNRPIEITLVRVRDKIKMLTAKTQLKNDPAMKKVYINPARTLKESQIHKKLQAFAKSHKGDDGKYRIRNQILQIDSQTAKGYYYVTKEGNVERQTRDDDMVGSQGSGSQLFR